MRRFRDIEKKRYHIKSHQITSDHRTRRCAPFANIHFIVKTLLEFCSDALFLKYFNAKISFRYIGVYVFCSARLG